MSRIFQSLFLLIAKATDSQLADYVEYLKIENQILRDKLPKRISLTRKERNRLIQAGRSLGIAIKNLITIVSYRTFMRWLATKKEAPTSRIAQTGRPSTEAEISDLVLKIGRENGWGYTRIQGELKKLGISLGRSTIARILKEHGIDTAPQRGAGSWADFVKRHAATLWQCDFFSQKVWTTSGLKECFVLAFFHVGSRRLHVTGLTQHPDRAWVVEQARNFKAFLNEGNETAEYVTIDHDTKFVKEFDEVFAEKDIKVKRVGPRMPKMQAYVERVIGSIRRELLDHFIFFGEKHLQRILSAYELFYNEARPHQGLKNLPLPMTEAPEILPFEPEQLVCDQQLGGLLKSYRRAS